MRGVWGGCLAWLACTGGSQDSPETRSQPATAAATSVPDSGSASSRSAAATRILIVGTSLTAGLGLDDPNDAYPRVMQRLADSAGLLVQVADAGVSGETTAGALRRIDWVMREGGDVVILEAGANDGLRGLNVDTTEANLRELIRKVRQRLPEAKIALAQMEAPPNLGPEYTARFRAAFARVAESEGVALIPFFLDGVAGVARLNQGDGIHPNTAGARRAAENMWRAVAPLVRSAP